MLKKVALVSGASKNVGASIARELGRRGLSVAVNYLSDGDGAATVAKAIETAGGEAAIVQGDVTQPDEVQRIVEMTVKRFGTIDVLVNNANIPHRQAPFMELSWQDLESKLANEMKAAFFLSQAVVPLMTANSWGRLIFISSDHSHGPIVPGMLANGTAKSALTTFAKYLAHELGRRGITSNVLSLGMVDTDRTRKLPAELRQRIIGTIPLGRPLEPDGDVAGVACFLAGEDGRYVTGAEIPVNGGFGISRLAPPNPAPER